MSVVLTILSSFLAVAALALLFRSSRTQFLQYVVLLRFPIILGTGLVWGWVLGSGPDAFLRNLFVVPPLHLGVIAGVAVLLSWVVMYTALLQWTRFPRRLGGEKENRLWQPLKSTPFRMAMFSCLALPVIVECIVSSAAEDEGSLGVLVVSALLGALSAGLAVKVLNVVPWLTTKLIEALHQGGVGSLEDKLDAAVRSAGERVVGAYHTSAESRTRSAGGRAPLFVWPRPGFGGGGQFAHGRAFLYFLLTAIVYYSLSRSWRRDLVWSVDHSGAPALAYLLVLLIALAWLLPFMSFVLDRHRLPVTPILALAFWAAYSALGTDQHYATVEVDPERMTANELSIERYLGNLSDDEPLVVVAASGGGIAASAWTAEVLTGLQSDLGPMFARALRLISATSGGSVGAMYYLDAFDPDAPPEHLAAVRAKGAASSLSALAWGLLYRDLWAFVEPDSWKTGRGAALEKRWNGLLDHGDGTLLHWRGPVVRMEMPALVFNATLVESGERLALSTLPTLTQSDACVVDGAFDREASIARGRGRRRFSELYPHEDITVATAARLSATFPWVTPVALPEGAQHAHGKRYHVGDGGYYDNYGVMSALEYIDLVFSRVALAPPLGQSASPRAILIEIRASDSSAFEPAQPERGFHFETLGPVDALYSVRSASQRARNEFELRTLQARWGADRIQRFVFELSGNHPLSWHLTSHERQCIADAWGSTVAIQRERERLLRAWESRMRYPAPWSAMRP